MIITLKYRDSNSIKFQKSNPKNLKSEVLKSKLYKKLWTKGIKEVKVLMLKMLLKLLWSPKQSLYWNFLLKKEEEEVNIKDHISTSFQHFLESA